MLLWSRGKFGYDSVKVASQSVVSDNDTRSKSELLEIAKDGHNLGECDLKVIKGAFSGSNAPSRTQANCAGTGFSKYCLRHEAGHTWGLAHDGIYDSISCEKIDSGVSQMSGYKTGFNIPHLHWLGWVEENEVKQLQWDNSNSDNFVFGEHWISIRPLSINESSQEGEYPYGLVIDLRRSGNRLWLASNREDILFSPESDEYSLKEDLLLAMLSPPFELKNLKDANRWKETQIYRFIDENNPWDDELMDDIVISVVTRTDKAMLIRIEQAVVDSCSELPLASYRIVKNYSSIDELEDMGKNNLKIDFKFELNYSERDEICSKSICDVNSLKLNEWDTCYFEDDIERVNLLENNKVSIKYKDDVDNCGSLMTFKTKFSRTDQEYYRDKFSKNIICKSAYQCLYKVKDSFKFPVNGEKQEDSTQDVGIQVIYPSQWKNIIDRRNNGEEWKDGPYF